MKKVADFDACVDYLIELVGREINIAIPLGLGKPIRFINALYRRARSDKSITLTINTALTLEKPVAHSDFEKRFLDPFVARVFSGCPDLDYAIDRRLGRLPPNVRVFEFFFAPGSMIGNARAQQNYVASNYTHVARDMEARGVNAIAQLVASREIDGRQCYSLSCNPDVTLELVRNMRQKQQSGVAFAVIAETNSRLPFMYRDAMVDADYFDAVVDLPATDFELFGTPRPAINDVDHMIGVYASTLVPDGGTLQIGIGSLGDAIANALIVRDREPDIYSSLLESAGIVRRHGQLIDQIGGIGRFEKGLYAATEMLVDGIMQLYQRGIVRRRVYDNLIIQTLLNQGRIRDDDPGSVLDVLLEENLVPAQLNQHAFEYLQMLGVIADTTRFEDPDLVAADGTRIEADLSDEAARARVRSCCLGTRLKGGILIHGGFFLGPRDFYQTLASMPREESELICMTGVESINQLYGREKLDTLQRSGARFVNSCLMVSLLGNAISETLENGQVVSGVGGQYNFVSMAHAMRDGRSILLVRSTRKSGGKTSSNILWRYGRATIPRHLRDIVISEYGIADLRSKSDSEVIAALINIADSRFQQELRRQAIAAGKLSPDHRIDEAYRNNTPQSIASALAAPRRTGHFTRYPFGSELTDVEQMLAQALQWLRSKSQTLPGKTGIACAALWPGAVAEAERPLLQRMKLLHPENLRERVKQRILLAALRATRAISR